MVQFREIIGNYGLYVLALILLQIPHTISGANNLNMYDGVTTPYIIGGDIFFEIVEPSELRYTYRIRPAKNFGAEFNESFSLTNTKLVVMDPEDGCTPPDNQELLEGHVALAVRGECSFLHKTMVAEEAGARALIITEQDDNPLDPSGSSADLFIEMIDDRSDRDASIPAAFLLGRNGVQIQNILERLDLQYAIINIPINMTYVSINKMNQPPWISW